MRHILCFGNSLHGDDGFGFAVFQRLSSLDLPADVQFFDVGTGGLNALVLFENCQQVFIVDALKPNGNPAQFSQPRVEDILLENIDTMHGTGVGYLLRVLTETNPDLPEIRILAVEAQTVTPFHPQLSEAMQNAVEPAVTLLLKWLNYDSKKSFA
jgi:hydrogenase maturation protease